MRAVIQRVCSASVSVDGRCVSAIKTGIVAYIGVSESDCYEDAEALAEKIANLRIFDDEQGTMNISVLEAGGEVLAISQFTILGDARKGRRPSYINAAPAETARNLFAKTISSLRDIGARVKEGAFQASMLVELVNDGPVTILLDTHKRF